MWPRTCRNTPYIEDLGYYNDYDIIPGLCFAYYDIAKFEMNEGKKTDHSQKFFEGSSEHNKFARPYRHLAGLQSGYQKIHLDKKQARNSLSLRLFLDE